MGINRGKQFESVIKTGFEKIPDCSVDRIPDQTSGYKGSSNICDFSIYKYPVKYYVECKSCYGNTLSFSNITHTQWKGLYDKSMIPGVVAGYMIWFIDRDATVFVTAQAAVRLKELGHKSININDIIANKLTSSEHIFITGEKRRILFDYNLTEFLQWGSSCEVCINEMPL